MSDKIRIKILEDGGFKIETSKVSMANHTNAAGLSRALVEAAGGKVETHRTSAAVGHVHDGQYHEH